MMWGHPRREEEAEAIEGPGGWPQGRARAHGSQCGSASGAGSPRESHGLELLEGGTSTVIETTCRLGWKGLEQGPNVSGRTIRSRQRVVWTARSGDVARRRVTRRRRSDTRGGITRQHQA